MKTLQNKINMIDAFLSVLRDDKNKSDYRYLSPLIMDYELAKCFLGVSDGITEQDYLQIIRKGNKIIDCYNNFKSKNTK